MFDRWGRRVDWPETSGAGADRVDGQVVVGVGDEQNCRDLLAAALEELRQAIDECDRIKVADGRPECGRSGMIPWRGGPRLYEELYWYGAPTGWLQRRRTPGLEVQAYVQLGSSFTKSGYFRTTLTMAADGVPHLGSVPATPDSLREWFAQGKAEKQKSWDGFPPSPTVFRLFRRQRRRAGDRQASDTQESRAERQLFLRNFDVNFQLLRDDDLDLFGGQPISATGDEQQCKQRLTAVAEDLREAIEDCESHIWPVGGRQWLRDRLQAILRVEEPQPERGKAGMIPHWDGGPRMYEEIHWDPHVVDRVRFWSQSRHTIGLEVQTSLPVELDSGKRRTWKATLTVSDGGITELGSVPATPDSLRDWFAQCVAEMAAVPRPEILGRPRQEGEIISRSSGADLVLTRKKLLEARRLLDEDIELSSRRSSDRGPRLREKTGTVNHPGMIWTWYGSPRLFEEAYWWQGDQDSDDPWKEFTRTLGYRWEYGLADSTNSHTDVLMTVSADQVVELCVSGYLSGRDAEAYPATIENFRAILDRGTH